MDTENVIVALEAIQDRLLTLTIKDKEHFEAVKTGRQAFGEAWQNTRTAVKQNNERGAENPYDSSTTANIVDIKAIGEKSKQRVQEAQKLAIERSRVFRDVLNEINELIVQLRA